MLTKPKNKRNHDATQKIKHKVEYRNICGAFAALALIVSPLAPFAAHADSAASTVAGTTITPTDAADIASEIQAANLPLAGVETYPAENALGTVIYLPQVHLDPGSDPSDPTNDAAVTAQNQIYSILAYLVKNMGLKYVMAEGDIYGPVPQTTIDNMKSAIAVRDGISKDLNAAESDLQSAPLDPTLDAGAEQEAQNAVAEIDREVALQGAPYKLKAEGADFALYGAETSSTYDKSAGIVRDYIYLQDRMNQLSGGASALASTGIPQLANISDILNALGAGQSGNGAATDPVENLRALAAQSGRSSLVGTLGDMEGDLRSLNENASAKTSAPTRGDNPYASVNDPNVIKQKLDQDSQEVTATVLDERNHDAAENFGKGLAAENASVGVLQFGAGHKDGLVKELNNAGFSVVVVTAEEVAKMPANDAVSQPTGTAVSTQSNAAATNANQTVELLKQMQAAANQEQQQKQEILQQIIGKLNGTAGIK